MHLHVTWTKIVSGLTPKWYMISILCPFLHVVCAVLCLIGKTVKTVEVLGEVVDECVWCNSINWNVIMYLCAVRVIDYKCSQYQLLANACWVVVVYVCAMILLKERLGCLIWYFFSQEAAEAARQDYFYCSRGKMHFNINKHCFNVSSPEWSIKIQVMHNFEHCTLLSQTKSDSKREREILSLSIIVVRRKAFVGH